MLVFFRRSFTLVTLLTIIGLSGCGGGEDTPPKNGPSNPPTAYLAEGIISVDTGGQVAIDGTHSLSGTAIFVPPYSLSVDTTFTIDTALVDSIHGHIGDAITFAPANSAFTPNARITLVYPDEQIPSGVSEDSLVIARILQNNSLQRLSNISVDTEKNQISADVSTLSNFGVFLPDALTLPHLPIADAGLAQTITMNDIVVLDSTNSSDLNGGPLDYQWELLNKPPTSLAVLSADGVMRPDLVVDKEGRYEVQLMVTDSDNSSVTDTVILSTQNSIPRANAGRDQTALINSMIELDGSGSTDVDGDLLSFRWSLSSSPAGSSAVLHDDSTLSPSLVIDTAGEYIAQLIVNDGHHDSVADTVHIHTANSRPVAMAGDDIKATIGNVLTLDGSASFDVNGDELDCRWAILSSPLGSTAYIARQESMRSLIEVDKEGLYVIQLIVYDEGQVSRPDTLVISVGDENTRPVAIPSSDKTVPVGQTITLNASASVDQDGDALTYQWAITHKPTNSQASLSDPGAETTSFSADQLGVYLAQLIVYDGFQYSQAATVLITTEGSRPTAVAGADQTAKVGDTLYLDGSTSSDGNGDTLSFSWSLTTQPQGSIATLSNPSSATPSLILDKPGIFIAQLIVNDGSVDSLPDTLTIQTENSAPVAHAGPDLFSLINAIATLDGSASWDADDNTLTYHWALLSAPQGSTAELTQADTTAPKFVPDIAGDYVFSLVVNDGVLDSPIDQARIVASNEAPPVISAILPMSASIGELVSMRGENFKSVTGQTPAVKLVSRKGGFVNAPVTYHDDTEIKFTVPNDAMTGVVTAELGVSVSSADELQIVASSSFHLIAEPSSLNLMRGQSGAYSIRLESDNDFFQLALLSIAGLPDGVSASFSPPKITAGQTSILRLIAPETQSLATTVLQLNATAEIDGEMVMESRSLSLTIDPISTSLAGRVVLDDTERSPMQGVIVSFEGINDKGEDTGCTESTITNAAGSFTFNNLPVECHGYQVIHYDGGTNVTNLDPGFYASVEQRYFIDAETVATPPGPVHLPRLDTKESVSVIQNHTEDQYFTFETIPNLEVLVYAGTTFTLKGGGTPDPFIMYAADLETDRIPGQTPNMGDVVIPRLLALQPDGTHVSQPMIVTFPNVMGLPPGTELSLLSLDPLKGMLAPYGTGKVSANGLQIIPDENPDDPGKQFGLTYLDWHGPLLRFLDNLLNKPPTPPGTCSAALPSSSKPIDFSSGLEILNEVDFSLDCSRGGIVIARSYRTLSNNTGPFGIGSGHNYSYRLDTASPHTAQLVNMVMPDGAIVPLSIPTVSRATGGSAVAMFINSVTPGFIGDRLTTRSNGEASYRFKDGRVFNFTPDTREGVSHLSSIIDAQGNKITLHRNSSVLFEIEEIEDPTGRIVQLVYDNRSRITTITDPTGREIKYTYNAGGTLASVIDLTGQTTRYEYDNRNRLLRKFDALNIKHMENVYDDNGRVIEQTYADGGTMKLAYFLMNSANPTSPVRMTAVTYPSGQQILYRFNPQGYLISAHNHQGPLMTVSFNGAPATPLITGETTLIERAAGTNQILSIKGNAICGWCGNPATGDVSFSYDYKGNRTTMTDAAGNTFRFTYEPVFSKITSVTDPLGNQSFIEYDAAGNVTKTTDAHGNETLFEYDIHGLLSSVTDPLGNQASIEYDSFANPVKTVDPLGNEAMTRFDAVSRPIATIDGLSHRSQKMLDDLGRTTETVDANGHKTSFEYDALGRLLKLTDARGNATRFTYDVMHRVVARTDSLGKADAREYDLNGSLIKYTDRKGQVTSFEYDELNRPIKQSYDDNSSIEFKYDARSRLIEVDDSVSGTHRYRYDMLGRVTESISPQGTIQYQYDVLGRLTQRHVLGQQPVQYTYDAVGNLTGASTPDAQESYSYNTLNQLTDVSRNNGVDSAYAYDAAGRLTSVNHEGSAGVIASQRYEHDANSQRITNTLSNAQPQITVGSMTQVDDVTNRLFKQIIDQREKQFTYDDNGNRLTSVLPEGTTSYTWNARNQLSVIQKPNGERHQFHYDYAGNMIKHETLMGTATSTETYLLDMFTNVVFQSHSNGEQFSVLTAPGIDQHLALIHNDGRVTYLLRDGLNSTMATVDGAGNVAGRFYYEAFGQTTVQGESVPFQFTGRVPVVDGLYYYRARFYDTGTGQFISQDPIGFAGGDGNLYRYVGNSVASNTDPTGLKCEPGIGCWTTAAELALANSGDYLGYYELASKGGDTYAGFAHGIAGNSNVLGWLTTGRLESFLMADRCWGPGGVNDAMEDIRINLAKSYANYLPGSRGAAHWPTVSGVAKFHWDVFAVHGVPPNAFGGTPLGKSWAIFPGVWLPNRAR